MPKKADDADFVPDDDAMDDDYVISDAKPAKSRAKGRGGAAASKKSKRGDEEFIDDGDDYVEQQSASRSRRKSITTKKAAPKKAAVSRKRGRKGADEEEATPAGEEEYVEEDFAMPAPKRRRIGAGAAPTPASTTIITKNLPAFKVLRKHRKGREKSLRQLIVLNQDEAYTQINCPYSHRVPHKYCDITGLPGNYRDPASGLEYYSRWVYGLVQTMRKREQLLTNYLEMRNVGKKK